MEIPGFITVLYCMSTIPYKLGLSKATGIAAFQAMPIGNKTMATIYTVHYLYRAVLSPLFLNPSMSPIHPFIFCSAFAWQVVNGLSLGGWLAGYGPQTVQDWSGRVYWIEVGLVIWGWSLLGNIFHDDELREIRRQVGREQGQKNKESASKGGKANVDKVYKVPQNGLFHFILYPHYFCEWLEWAGFWMIGGLNCVPARSFLLNEIFAMFPRALQGRQWYIDKFGREKIGKKKAIIPFVI